tara:strand:+ start:56 stop:439 length:384 start_codon:yes stop_codon:yes gene_type:complete
MHDFEELRPQIKELVIPTIIESLEISPIHDEMPDNAMAEIIFTHLLALASNDEDINATVTDLMPFRNPFIYNGSDEDDAAKMSMILLAFQKDFQFQFMAIKGAMEDIDEGLSEKELILNVKKLLLNT